MPTLAGLGSRLGRLAAGALFALLAIGCDRANTTASTYEDCVLNTLRSDMGVPAIAAAKLACKQKYPRTHDFNALASKQAGPAWAEVIRRPNYAELNDEEAAATEEVYFSRFVQQALHPDFVEDARQQFTVFARHAVQSKRDRIQAGAEVAPSALRRPGALSEQMLEELGEKFGAALAAAEALRVLGTQQPCAYIYLQAPPSVREEAHRLLAQAPVEARRALQVFENEGAPPVIALRRTSQELVEETLRRMRGPSRMDERTACGATAGVLISGAKSTADQWFQLANRVR